MVSFDFSTHFGGCCGSSGLEEAGNSNEGPDNLVYAPTLPFPGCDPGKFLMLLFLHLQNGDSIIFLTGLLNKGKWVRSYDFFLEVTWVPSEP